jgi:hypothetical protein
MEVLCSSGTSITVYHSIQHTITENVKLQHHYYDKYKSLTIYRYI